jgi:hypothetical protein
VASNPEEIADDAEIEGDSPPANTTKKRTPLTVEERQQFVSQLMRGCTWVEDAPKLDKKGLGLGLACG